MASTNKLCATKVNGLQCKLLAQRSSRHYGFAFDGNTWQKVILIWQKQPSNLIQ